MDTRIRIIAEAITKDAENSLKRLADLEKELQDETIKAGDATKKQETHLNTLNDTASKSNNTFSNLGKTMLALFAVDKLIDYSKQLVTLMGDTDKYRIALQNVSASQKEYEKSIAFLSKLSSDYGQNVNLLTQSYTSFIASSKSSNLSLEARQKIYESIIKAGSSLKLSNEGIEGSLRAVSQMFSKGNVSAEELRGQLGERLPGAFGIMAKSMGVSEKQLNKMLEQGEVLAKDVLPKFAEELEKLYGDKAQSNLKTIGGAWNVFVNNFIEGLQDFNKSSLFIETISGWILSAANSLKVFIGWIKEAFTIGTQYNTVLNKWYDYYEVIYDAISKIVVAGWDLIKSLGQIIANIVGAGDATLTFRKVVDYMIVGIKIMGSVLIGAVTVVQVLADAFNVALNYGMRFANFFGKDFKIDPNATFSNLAKNAETNFKRITDLWGNSSEAIIGTAKNTNKVIVEEDKKKTDDLQDELDKQNEGHKKANKEKLSDFEKYMAKKTERESKYFEESKKQMDKAVDSYIKSLKKQNQEEIKLKEGLMKEIQEQTSIQMKYMDNSMMISEIRKATSLQEIADIEKKYSKLSYDRALQDLNDKLTLQKREYAMLKSAGLLNVEEDLKRSTEIKKTENEILSVKLKSNKDATDDYKKNLETQGKDLAEFKENRIKTEEEIAEEIKQINQAAYTVILGMASMLLDDITNALDEKINKSTDLVEKAKLENKKAWASTGKEALGFLDALASGNVVQGVFSAFKTFYSAMNNTMNESTRIWEAEVAKLTEELKTGWDVLSGSLSSVKDTYGTLVDDTATLKNLWEDDSIEGRINAEIKIGENINKNFTEAIKNEESLHNQKVSNINKELADSIDAINKKYDYEFTKLNQKFDAESLAIQQGVNFDLMTFVTNQDLKLGLTSAYESKRAQIAETFALAYKPITEDMTETEINGINEAIKARDAAFAQLELWQTSQIQFVIDNGKLERDTFTATQIIISDGKESQYQLSLKYQAAEIALEIQKGVELLAAENTKNINIEKETERHESVITQLGLDRDAALEASFIRLRDVMTEGYSKMYEAAYNAYLQGKLTAEQFKEAANNLLYLMDLLQKGEVIPKKEDLDKYIEPIVLPRFNTGTEMVGGVKGVDKNLAWLSNDEAVLQGDLNKKRLDKGINRFQMVEYAINYKSILDGGLQPLKVKTSALDKLEEHKAMQYLINMNVGEIVDKLSAVERSILGKPTQIFDLSDGKLREYVKTDKNVTIFKNKRLK